MIINDLKTLEKESREEGIPIIGAKKGAYLLGKVKELQPQLILELGTANGYSGTILGSQGAKLITVEQDPRRLKEAAETFPKFNIKATIINNDCQIETKRTAEDKKNHNTFDMIFLDFEKKGYIKVLNDCIKLLKKGGVMIADNISHDYCKDFKEKIRGHKKLKTEIINIEDGLSCSVKV